MKAFVVDRYRSTDAVRAGDLPEPVVGEQDVLVQVHAASVNPIDSKVSHGDFKLILPHQLPFALGHDLAGVVVRVGSGVRRFAPGDEVYGQPDKDRIGTFAELVVTHQDSLALKPATLSMEEAAAVPMVALTSWQALVERGQVHKGQKVLIHAGSGGVGTFAIQLAKHLGASVATTTSTKNVDLVTGLGADVVVDYTKDDFETVLHDYDLVLDPLGGKIPEKSLRVLKPGGMVIGISGPPDPTFAKDAGLSWFLRLAMTALSYRIRKQARRRNVSYSFLFMHPAGDQLREISALIDAGILSPVIDRVFPFESTTEALAYVETGRAKGKVIIKVR
jgi:NADPH:quinone reductase-like Zn-dependent oxidoreductase